MALYIKGSSCSEATQLRVLGSSNISWVSLEMLPPPLKWGPLQEGGCRLRPFWWMMWQLLLWEWHDHGGTLISALTSLAKGRPTSTCRPVTDRLTHTLHAHTPLKVSRLRSWNMRRRLNCNLAVTHIPPSLEAEDNEEVAAEIQGRTSGGIFVILLPPLFLLWKLLLGLQRQRKVSGNKIVKLPLPSLPREPGSDVMTSLSLAQLSLAIPLLRRT